MKIKITRKAGHKPVELLAVMGVAEALNYARRSDKKATVENDDDLRAVAAQYKADHEAAAGDPPSFEINTEEISDPAPAAPAAPVADKGGK